MVLRGRFVEDLLHQLLDVRLRADPRLGDQLLVEHVELLHGQLVQDPADGPALP